MEERLIHWLENRPSLPDSLQVSGRKEGENNHNYILKSRSENYVVRIPRKGSESRLASEAEMLEFLDEEGISNVPNRILYSEEYEGREVLVESHVGERELQSGDLNERKLENLASLLADIHSIPISSYNDFFGKSKPEKTTLEKVYREDFQKWSQERLEEYHRLCDEPDERLEKYSPKQRELFESADLDVEVPITVIHGDLSHNIRGSGDDIYIIDWELGRSGYPVHDLLYFLHRQDLDMDQKEHLLSAYRKHRDLPGYEKTKNIYPKFLAFNDVIWAANRMVKNKGEERERFRSMFEDRMERLENVYSKD